MAAGVWQYSVTQHLPMTQPLHLVIISDTHGLHDSAKVPDGDVLIHCGDCTNDIGQANLRAFLTWFEAHPHKHKILIAGNHDGAFEKWPILAVDMVKQVAPSVTYLQDTGVIIEGVRFYGSPVTPTFFDWFFMRERGKAIRAHWDLIPSDTDVLITHGPPQGYGDWSPYERVHAGDADLLDAIKRAKPQIACHGHFHGGYGSRSMPHDDSPDTTWVINASVCNEYYQPVNKAICISVTPRNAQ